MENRRLVDTHTLQQLSASRHVDVAKATGWSPYRASEEGRERLHMRVCGTFDVRVQRSRTGRLGGDHRMATVT